MSEPNWRLPESKIPSGQALNHIGSDGREGLFSRLPDGTVVGFLNVCTHMGCRLVRTDIVQLGAAGVGGPCTVLGPCPCHGTTFDLAARGLVVFGPATQDLPALTIEHCGDDIIATVGAFDPLAEQWPDRDEPLENC